MQTSSRFVKKPGRSKGDCPKSLLWCVAHSYLGDIHSDSRTARQYGSVILTQWVFGSFLWPTPGHHNSWGGLYWARHSHDRADFIDNIRLRSLIGVRITKTGWGARRNLCNWGLTKFSLVRVLLPVLGEQNTFTPTIGSGPAWCADQCCKSALSPSPTYVIHILKQDREVNVWEEKYEFLENSRETVHHGTSIVHRFSPWVSTLGRWCRTESEGVVR